METGQIVTVVVTVSLAILGYGATYANNLRIARRADRLARVNRQLAELYGPLFSLAHASDTAWNAFRSKYRPGGPFFSATDPPTEEELKAWRLWMTIVFTPLNQRMQDLVVSKADLLMEQEMPPCLLALCAHVSTYQAVMKRWEAGDFAEHTSVTNYSAGELMDYCQRSFRALKREQAQLLGAQTGRPTS